MVLVIIEFVIIIIGSVCDSSSNCNFNLHAYHMQGANSMGIFMAAVRLPKCLDLHMLYVTQYPLVDL